jgi:hypothetical protein
MFGNAMLTPKLVIRLDGRGVAGLTVGLLAVGAGTFVTGVYVGREHADALPGSFDELAGFQGSHADLESVAEYRRRNATLAKVGPGTRPIEETLSRPSEPSEAESPTDAARIETHRQLAGLRGRGYQQSLGPVAVAAASPEAAPWVEMSARSPGHEAKALARGEPSQGYTLEVSAFATEPPARVVAAELEKAGYPTQVRPGERQGKPLWRVEVGRFADGAQAAEFQKRFERAAGYSTVVVPVR